jgi:predicted DCC family thiol-disulfide oxidoreductase YuxK
LFFSIIVYDGVCIFCNKFILFLVKLDKSNNLKICELQSSYGQNLLMKYNLSKSNFETIYLIHDNKVYDKSSAIIKIFSSLGKYWRLIEVLFLIPKIIRDQIYCLVAKHRHKLYSNKMNCNLPNEDFLKRILR